MLSEPLPTKPEASRLQRPAMLTLWANKLDPVEVQQSQSAYDWVNPLSTARRLPRPVPRGGLAGASDWQ